MIWTHEVKAVTTKSRFRGFEGEGACIKIAKREDIER
jgi:hypothetical protein